MTSTETYELIEQWRQQEERETMRIEEEATEKWYSEIEPEQRRIYLDDAEEAWDSLLEPAESVRYVDAALDAWTVGELDRWAAFCAAHRGDRSQEAAE